MPEQNENAEKDYYPFLYEMAQILNRYKDGMYAGQEAFNKIVMVVVKGTQNG